MDDDNSKINELQREEIDVQREILRVMYRWSLSMMYISALLTVWFVLKILGVR